jgi:putative NADH-flavin reductase
MKVLLLGATGFSGRAVLAKALEQHHEVTVLVRNASRWKLRHPNLTILEGDALDRASVAKALRNQDAVFQCLGVGGKGDGKPNSFVSDATALLVEEMQQQQVKRLIAMSNVGAGNSMAFLPAFFTKIILPLTMKWLQAIIEDKNRMEPIIMNSRLDWTIARCPNILDKKARNTCHVSLDGKGLKWSITLPDMAEWMVGQLTDRTYIRQAPCISN